MRLLALLVLLPAVALAQTSTLALDFSGSDSVVVGAGDCAATRDATWGVTLLGQVCSDLQFWATQGDCGEGPATVDTKYDSVPMAQLLLATARSGPVHVKVNELPGLTGGACGQRDVETTYKICGSFTSASIACGDNTKITVKATKPPEIIYDTKAPPVPTITAVLAGDRALTVHFDAPQANEVAIEARAQGAQDFEQRAKGAADTGFLRVEGLENGTAYEVRAIAEDAAGNDSGPSNVRSGTPVPIAGFFETYRAAGGEEAGGCAAAPGWVSILGPVLLVLAASARRRRS